MALAPSYASGGGVKAHWRRWLSAVLEVLLVGGVYLLYRAGRLLARGQESVAIAHAGAVHDLEAALRLPSESAVQGLVPSADVLTAANWYYVTVHFPSVVGVLVWGFLCRPRSEYVWVRNLLILQTTLALVIHIAWPLAPPRMFPEWGFVDTMTVHGPSAYSGASGALANQYAAMPSLHVGWAVLIAVVVTRCGPLWLRCLAIAHAALTVLVVTVTANHWLLDGVVAVGLLVVALVVLPPPAEAVRVDVSWRRRPRPEGPARESRRSARRRQ